MTLRKYLSSKVKGFLGNLAYTKTYYSAALTILNDLCLRKNAKKINK